MAPVPFISDEFSDNPLVTQYFEIYPRYNIAPFQTVRLNWSLECEITQPDRDPARRCDPSDVRLSYHHMHLVTDPWIDGSVFAWGGLYLPSSYASGQNGTIMNVRLTGGYMASFFKNRLLLMYALGVQKYLPTQKTRADCPVGAGADGVARGDDGVPVCLPSTQGQRTAADADQGTTGSGGFMNDNWLLQNSFYMQYSFTPRIWASIFFQIRNIFAFSVPNELIGDPDLPSAAQEDWTRGIVEVAFMPINHLAISLGIDSYQPALTADNGSVRFPFYDFISPANNYTRWYIAARAVY